MKTEEAKSDALALPAPEPTGAKLPARQEAVLVALLAQPTLKEAAEAAGVSETTAWRYLQDEKFRERYRAAQRQCVEHIIVRVRQDAGAAVSALREIVDDRTAPASSRVQAARAILETVFKAVEVSEMEGRMEALEANLRRYAEREAAREAEESLREA
ncbi:MAG: LacI family DNA-binding transcriptional regulator [Chloroflexota bacterium]|nr:LacI family DNA-binding transcriptional regulator [Chloroflexota bacterium]